MIALLVHAPADRRFRRAQVRPARRRRLRDRWWARLVRVALVAAAVACAGYQVGDLILHASVLRIDRLVVRGNQRLSTGEVLALLEDLRGANILTADLAAWRRRLVASPWVGDASLRRVLPSTVEVHVTERRPMGLARVNEHVHLVDATGVFIDDYGPQYSGLDLPIIDGLVPGPPEAVPLVDQRRTALAARLIEAVGARRELARQISQIDVSDVYDAVVILEGDPALIHLGTDRFAERLQSYLELAPALRARVPEIDYVDLRFDERVYVRPAAPAAARPDAGSRPRTPGGFD